MNDLPVEPSHSSTKDTAYLVIVAVLGVIIIAALSVLWLHERRGRLAAEDELSRFTRRQLLQASLAEMLSRPQQIRREDLPSGTVDLNGHPRTILYMSAPEGERMGFRSGDLIAVGQGPSSGPAGQDDRSTAGQQRVPSASW